MPVRTVFENLEAGMSDEEIAEVFDVTPGGREGRFALCQREPGESAHIRLMKILFDNVPRIRLQVVWPDTRSRMRAGLAGMSWKTVN
jgi:hypothetical protein